MHPRVSDRPMSENIVDDMWELELCLRTQKGVRCSFNRRPCPTKINDIFVGTNEPVRCIRWDWEVFNFVTGNLSELIQVDALHS